MLRTGVRCWTELIQSGGPGNMENGKNLLCRRVGDHSSSDASHLNARSVDWIPKDKLGLLLN